jgi:hypothetical protein
MSYFKHLAGNGLATTAAPSTSSTPVRDKHGCLPGEVWDDIDRLCRDDPDAPKETFSTLDRLKARHMVSSVITSPQRVVAATSLPPEIDPKVEPPPEPPPTDEDPKAEELPLPPPPPPPPIVVPVPPPASPPPPIVVPGGGGSPPIIGPRGGPPAEEFELVSVVDQIAPTSVPEPKKGIHPLLLVGGTALVAYLVFRK